MAATTVRVLFARALRSEERSAPNQPALSQQILLNEPLCHSHERLTVGDVDDEIGTQNEERRRLLCNPSTGGVVTSLSRPGPRGGARPRQT